MVHFRFNSFGINKTVRKSWRKMAQNVNNTKEETQ